MIVVVIWEQRQIIYNDEVRKCLMYAVVIWEQRQIIYNILTHKQLWW